jgi:beta-lactamase regulating signal transducer with metallopeptidase domain
VGFSQEFFKMTWLPVQTVAQISVERALNALPEGFLIALFAWALLRILRRQNSGTRFAVWFLSLLTIAALPTLAFFGREAPLTASASSLVNLHPALTVPGNWAELIFIAWVLGAGIALTRLGAGLWRLVQLRRSCTPIPTTDLDPTVQGTLNAIGASSSKSGLARAEISIATSDRPRVPAAIGFWKRTIVLPAWVLRELPAQDLNAILLHESAHLRRWDDWTNLTQKLVGALFFFHPAVWFIEKQLSVEREMACDDAVLAATANPRGYAECLVSLLEKSLAHRGWSMAQAAVYRAREASLRLAQILDTERSKTTGVWKPAIGIVSAFALTCVMALQMAPKFVAVDRNASPPNTVTARTSNQNSSSSSFLSLPSPAAIPAALNTGGDAQPRVTTTSTAKVFRARSKAANSPGPPRVTKPRAIAPVPSDRLVEASATNQQVAPQFETLVFVEATQYANSAASIWRVQVWHVMLMNITNERNGKVPVANSI